jgi:hypothetical protein
VRDGHMAFTDIDNDGDQDLLITGGDRDAVHYSRLYRNVSLITAVTTSNDAATLNAYTSNGQLYIDMKGITEKDATLRIFDISGKLVSTYLGLDRNGELFSVPVFDLSSGIYVVELLMDGKHYAKKVKF